MKLPDVSPGCGAAFTLYEHYHQMSPEEQVGFWPILVAFEWGGLSRDNSAAKLAEAEEIACANVDYAFRKWFNQPTSGAGEEEGE